VRRPSNTLEKEAMPAVRKVYAIQISLTPDGPPGDKELRVVVQTERGKVYWQERIPENELVSFFDYIMDRGKAELRTLMESGEPSFRTAKVEAHNDGA
jgi:hypothetical protein